MTATRTGGDGMHLRIVAMGQVISVDSTLTADAVMGTVQVPIMLALMKSQIAQMVEALVGRMLKS